MDSFLELSVAAEVAAPIPPVSGFERTAAALLSPHFSEPKPDLDSSRPLQQSSSPHSTNLLSDELDLLADQELEILNAQQDVGREEHPSSQYLYAGASLSSFPLAPPAPPQQGLPELLQSSLEPRSRGPSTSQPGPVGDLMEHMSGVSSPLDQLSTLKDETTEGQQSVVDFTYLMTETPEDKPKLPLDLAASGRPSAFQVYKKQDPPHNLSEQVGVMPSDVIVGGARSKVNMLTQEPLGYMSGPWNLKAPVFFPRFHVNQGPAFITPVVQPLSNRPSQPRHPSPWLNRVSVNRAPLKPSASIPKSWALPAAPQFPSQYSRLRLEGKVLVLLRGAPGSGKSTLARALLEHNLGGVILCTDDYFTHNGEYEFDPRALGEAHEWNHQRAKDAFKRGMNPIIIDNTNMQGWEMKPYVALKHGYKVLFREPDTWWKHKPRELMRRTSHNVPVETIRRMLNGYERFVTVHAIMGSQMPECKQRLLLENRRDADMDLGELDSELDAHLEPGHSVGDQRIPDCIVESVMNEDHRGEELPMAFSESIGQRVRRERPSRTSGFDRMEPADLVKDTNQSQSEAKEKEKTKEEEAEEVEVNRDEAEKGMPKILDFAGDWPSEGSLEQRQLRRRARQIEGHKEEDEGVSQEANENKLKVQSGPDVTEFQKLLDLIQTGGAAIQTSSSRSSSLSSISAEEMEKEEKPGGRFEKSLGSISNSEEREQNMSRVKSSRGELPDCVLDWKAADSLKVRKSTTDNWEDLKTENEASSTTGGNDQLSEIDIETEAVHLKSTISINHLSADSLVKAPETDACHDSLGNHYTENEVAGSSDIDMDTNNYIQDGSHVSEACWSPVCEGSVEAECSGGSQERKQRQSRRSGKQCKLALTFTQNCPASSLNTPECPITKADNIDSSQNSINTDVKPNLDSDCNTSFNLKPDFDQFTESKLETHLQPLPTLPLLDTGCFTQTEPQDFAFLWRLNHPDRSDHTVITECSHFSYFTVLSGDSSRFMPVLSSAISTAVAVDPSDHKEIPYRVVHEKGTQVEEKDLGATQDRLESLRILSCYFKLVSFDTLEDLYDKCHQDLDWTTNLLLDSGEKFFRDEDGEKDEQGSRGEDVQTTFSLCGALGETKFCSDVLNESESLPKAGSAGSEDSTQESMSGTVSESNESSSTDFTSVTVPVRNKDHPDTTSHLEKSPQTELSQPEAAKEKEKYSNTEHKVISEHHLEDVWGGSLDDGVVIKESRVETEDDIASMEEVHRLLLAELEEMEMEEKQRKEEMRSRHLDIQSVELKLPTELALQLTELFGPVGIDPGICSADDFAVKMDLNLAKLIHQKWKETIQVSSLTLGSVTGPREQTQPARFLISADSHMSLDSQPDSHGQMPFMDHWNVSHPHVSLRDIIKEEQALQHNSRVDLDRRDAASLLKENQLYSLFPTIDRHFLQDIFRDHNYSLTQTELFLRSLLDEEPVKTVVAPEVSHPDHHRARQKLPESTVVDYQDTEDPEYEDFRAEASLQRSRQLESFAKAAEAYKQGRKEVASFYAQQGHLHGQRMREANHRAAVQIFERVNSSLLPRNILDLHGLHVDEALEHLAQVLQDKTTDCERGLCRPQLSVITGRGNHSQGGMARIRPAVIDYLTNKRYRYTHVYTHTCKHMINITHLFSCLLLRFTEPKPGLLLVSLN
uniref:Smr domain-containing protein n=1 Tax=Monopterus albus TaxID=43700 RepID=A0A3Q3J3L8_MONAL